jgi:hypothetical protein
MAGSRGLERLTAQDLLMLWADDFGWSEDIGVLAVLDGARLLDGDGRVRVDEVRRRLELIPVAAIMGNLTLAVAVLSYAGQLNLTVIADRDTCPDLEVFAQGMRAALDDLERPVCHTGAMRRNLLLR